MIKKALTYFTILAITALPVQLVSASTENVSMQMSMSQQAQAENPCLQDMTVQHMGSEQNSINKSCCDDSSHECQSCNNCPQAVSLMLLPLDAFIKTSSLEIKKYSTSYLFLNGVPQKNLLRPPRTTL